MNVKRLRAHRDLTQAELGQRAEVRQAFIAQLETGQQINQELDTRRQLAKAWKVSVVELVE